MPEMREQLCRSLLMIDYVSTCAYTNKCLYVYAYLLETMPEMREQLCRFIFIYLSMSVSVSKYILTYLCYLYVSKYLLMYLRISTPICSRRCPKCANSSAGLY